MGRYRTGIIIIEFKNQLIQITLPIQCLLQFLSYGRELETEEIVVTGLQVFHQGGYRELKSLLILYFTIGRIVYHS